MSASQKKNLWDSISNLALIRFLLLFASGWALLQLLAYFETVIVVFTFSGILAFLLSYPVRWLQRFLPRGIAVGLVFLLSLVFVGGLTITVGLAFLSQGQQLIDRVTEFVNALAPLSERTEAFLRQRNLQVNLRVIEEQLRSQALAVVVSSIAILQGFITNLVSLILIWVVSFFMVLDGERLWRLVLKILPVHLHDRLTVTIQRNFLGFFQGQLILMLFMTTASFLVMLAFGVNFPLVLAVILGVFELVPGIGATLGISLIFFLVLAQNVWIAFKVLLSCIILQQLQDNLLYPRIMRNSLNIHPILVFFALLIGARAAGMLGIFIAIPVAGVLVSWFEIEEMRGEGEIKIKVEKIEV